MDMTPAEVATCICDIYEKLGRLEMPPRKYTRRFSHHNRTKQAAHRRVPEPADRYRKQNRYSPDNGCP